MGPYAHNGFYRENKNQVESLFSKKHIINTSTKWTSVELYSTNITDGVQGDHMRFWNCKYYILNMSCFLSSDRIMVHLKNVMGEIRVEDCGCCITTVILDSSDHSSY